MATERDPTATSAISVARRLRGRTVWAPIAAVFLLGAAVRALRFGGRFRYLYHWDETGVAIPALEILRGSLPVHFLGFEYMGNTGSYPLAAWFALVGSSPLALDLFAYATGLAMLASGGLLAWRLFSPPVAGFTLAVLAAPPLFLAGRSLDGSLAYQLLLVLGNVFLIGTHGLVFGRSPRGPAFLALGLLAGVGVWANQLFAVYLVPFGVLALRTGLVGQPRGALFLAGALLGGTPVWLHELTHFPSSRFVLHDVGAGLQTSLPERATVLLTTYVPILLGTRDEVGTPLLAAGAATLLAAVVAAGILWRAAARDAGELSWTLGLGGRPATGASLLWWLLLANLALVLLTLRGGVGARYLFPLYSVLPCWLGEALGWLWRTRRLLGGPALAALLGIQLWTNWTDTLGGTPAGERRWRHLESDAGPLVRWLEARGIRHVYWGDVPDLAPYEFTYWNGGRIVAADLWRELALPYARRVDAAVAPAIVTTGDTGALRDTLGGLGIAVRETAVGRFRVVEPLGPAVTGVAAIGPDGWRVTASENRETAGNLVDRDVSTGWRTATPAEPGQWLAVDLGAETTVTRLDLLALDWQEVPPGFRVEASPDGRAWQRVSDVPRYWGPLFWSEHHPFLKVRRGRVQAIFPPIRTRLLRIVQTGTGGRTWGARELFVYGPAPPGPPPPPPGAIAAALRRQGVEFVYANHWLSALVQTESAGAVRAQESNLYPNSYGNPSPPPERLPRFLARPGRAILVGSDADAGALKTALAAQDVLAGETTAGPYRLLLLGSPPATPRRLPRDGWRTATAADQATVDLGAVRRVSRVRFWPGPAGGGPRALELAGSVDGAAWGRLGPLQWAGPLYWTGAELLRNGKDVWELRFPPRAIRYLRIAHPATEGGRPWVVREIECFE